MVDQARAGGPHPDAYAEADSLRLADRLEGKLLIIHGTSDVNATFSASMKLIEAFTRAGKHYDLVVLPEQPHGVVGPGGSYMLEWMAHYFVEHLQPVW
ncbi:MAG TPA: prolyl oligopeptidase family serine peptidase [Nitriliruptorales bacterium]